MKDKYAIFEWNEVSLNSAESAFYLIKISHVNNSTHTPGIEASYISRANANDFIHGGLFPFKSMLSFKLVKDEKSGRTILAKLRNKYKKEEE